MAEVSMRPEFVYLLGDSHVRSFSNDPGFVPLFIGSGKETRWTDGAFSARTERRLAANLARIPERAPVMLVFGEPDVRFCLADANAGPQDMSAVRSDLEACIERRTAATKNLLRVFPHRIAVYSCVPSSRPATHDLVRHYNRHLAAACDAIGAPFIDVCVPPVCDDRGVPGSEYQADEIHLNARIVATVRTALARFSMEPATHAENGFEWSDFIRIPVEDGADTRIWGSARLDSRSPEYAASEIRHRAAAAISDIADRAGIHRLGVLNAREGYVPLAIASRPQRAICIFEPSRLRRRLAEVVFGFAGRRDIEVCDDFRRPMIESEILIDFRYLREDDCARMLGENKATASRLLFMMPEGEDTAEVCRDCGFDRTGSVEVSVETKSGLHRAGVRYGCRSEDDRALIEAVFAKPIAQLILAVE